MPFDPKEYLTRRPDLVNNWNNSGDYERMYGTIENYALEDAVAHGTPADKAAITANDIVVPEGQKLEAPPPSTVGTIPANPPQRYLDEYNRVKAAGDTRDFKTWARDHQRETNDTDPEFLSWLNGTPVEVKDPNITDKPAEEELWNQILPSLLDDIAKDKDRSEQAKLDLAAINKAIANVNNIDAGLQSKLDGDAYLRSNPDVNAEFVRNMREDGRVHLDDGTILNRQQFAEWHYERNGKNEGRPATFISDRLRDEYGQTDKWQQTLIDAANEKAAAENAATAKARGELDQATTDRVNLMNKGTAMWQSTEEALRAQQLAREQEAAAKARAGMDAATQAWLDESYAGTQPYLDKLTGALDRETAARRAATGVSVGEQDAALAEQLATRKAALEAEAEGLRGAVGAEADAKRAALAVEFEKINAALTKNNTDRLANLTTEIGALRGVAGEAAASRRAALEAEVGELRAAQSPLNDARLAAAETLGSTINQGLERSLDGIVARQAQQGFVGSDNFTDSAMLRATLDARQGAAQAVQGAKVENAMDDRSIAVRAANERRLIENRATDDVEGIGKRSAYGTRGINDELAAGQLGLSKENAENNKNVSFDMAENISGIDQGLATGQRALTDFGADKTAAIRNWASGRNLGIADEDAKGRTDITKIGADRDLGIYDKGAAAKESNALWSTKRELGSSDAYSKDMMTIGGKANQRNLDTIDLAGKEWSDNARWATNRGVDTADSAAGDIQGAKGTAANMKLEYYNQDLPRQLNAALRPLTLVGDGVNARAALDDYSHSGARRALGMINWWAGNPAPADPKPFTTTPNTSMGEFWAGTGAGIAKIGGEYLLGKMGASKAPRGTTPD